MACLRLPLLRDTLFSSFSKLYPPSLVTTPDLTKDIFLEPLYREDSRLSRKSGRHLLKRVSQSLHRSHSHLLLSCEKEVCLPLQLNSEIKLGNDRELVNEDSSLKWDQSIHSQQQQQSLVLQTSLDNQINPREEQEELIGRENNGLKRPMSLNNLVGLNRNHFNEYPMKEMEMDNEGLLLEENDGREIMDDDFSDSSRYDNDHPIYNYNYNYKDEEDEDYLPVDEMDNTISAIGHLLSDQTYDLNVVNEIVLPPSVPPSPSPSPLYRKSEFSPIPSKSPLPNESQEIEEEERALEVHVDIQTSSNGNTNNKNSTVSQSSQEIHNQVLNLKDYTAISDHRCTSTLKQSSNRELYHTVRTALPSVFEWETVVEKTCYQSDCKAFPDAEWWQNR